MNKLLTPAQLAEIFQIPLVSVYRFLKREDIPMIRLGRLIRVDESDLKDWLARKSIPAQKHSPISLRPGAVLSEMPKERFPLGH